ncbi:MAG TPA: tripartite tricarboxylate transporter substrate-binding protein [Burkholderiaceae bacterium]|nr:tripartite tricarboxylate transporter substrate-binding protein [Burkholderiaceae bacterium]
MKLTVPRRRFLLSALSLPGVSLTASLAQSAPVRPLAETLQVVVGYPPGGSVDLVARTLAERLVPQYAGVALVENKPGAAGRMAVEEVRRTAPDGRTVLFTPASVVTLYPHVYRKLAYDPFSDLAPVSPVCASCFALAVGPRVPEGVVTVEAFARWCKANPTAAQCGNAGAGSMPHLMAALMGRELDTEFMHVPYRGGALAMQAVAAGDLACAIGTESAARALYLAGKIRVLATSGAERSPFFAAAATFREQGLPALTQREWFGMLAPARTPAANVDALAGLLRAVAREASVRLTLEKAALLPEVTSPAQMAAAMRHEYEFWGQVVRDSGFTPEA